MEKESLTKIFKVLKVILASAFAASSMDKDKELSLQLQRKLS
jgi:hypothetical protein